MSVETGTSQGAYEPQVVGRLAAEPDHFAARSTTRRPRRRPARLAPDEPVPQASAAGVVSAIAHELRTPLATLHAGLEILSDYPDLDSGEVRQLVERLQRGVAWLDCLIENLSTWSAIESGHLALRRCQGTARAWIEPAVDLVQPLLARRGQRVRLICRESVPMVPADSVRLGQVIVNLLVNAGKYGGEGDEFVVTVEPRAGGLLVAVTDHGTGIPHAEQEAIFRPHMRGQAALEAGVAGHGLGLSIVKAIVEAHGGAVGVTSATGHGTTFWFTVPSVED